MKPLLTGSLAPASLPPVAYATPTVTYTVTPATSPGQRP